MEADQLGRLRDILDSARLIATYMRDTLEPEFRKDFQKQDAVIRRIEIIGEATAHLTEQTRQAIPELPFRKMKGMRNIIAHDYGLPSVAFGVPCGTVYQNLLPRTINIGLSRKPLSLQPLVFSFQ